MKLNRTLIGIAGLIGIIGISGSLPLTALAAENKEARVYRIEKDQEVTGDQYIGADIVVIDGTLRGDLLTAAEKVTVNGTVTGGIISLAGAVTINGTVGGSLRTGSNSLVLAGKVGGDVTSIAAQITHEEGASITGNLYYIAEKVTGTPTVGKTSKRFADQGTKPDRGFALFLLIESFLSLGLLGAALYSFQSAGYSEELAGRTRAHFPKHLLLGLAACIFVPIAGVLLLITLIGKWIALILLGGFAILLLVSTVDAAYFMARLVLGTKPPTHRNIMLIFIFGSLLFTVLFNIPLVALIPAAILLACLGTRLNELRASLHRDMPVIG